MNEQVTRGNDDVVTFLERQHEEIARRMEAVLAASGADRDEAFRELRRLLAVHETAEEEILHPAARLALQSGDALVEERLEEEKTAKRALMELERLETSSFEFQSKFLELRSAVLAHAAREEQEEFGALAVRLHEGRLGRMRRVVELAESMAPTRPHPGVESAAANLLVGPIAAMVDRVRDALTDRSGVVEPERAEF